MTTNPFKIYIKLFLKKLEDDDKYLFLKFNYYI